MPSAMVGAISVGTRRSECAWKAAANGAQRAACRTEDPRPPGDLAAPQQLGEADVGTEDVAAVAERHHDVVRRREAELLPQLVSQRLDPFHEEGLPVVARIEDLRTLAERRLGHVLARTLDRHDVRAAGSDLGDLRIRRGLGHEHAALHAGGSRGRRTGDAPAFPEESSSRRSMLRLRR